MDSLVSTEWLAAELGAGGLKVIDASMHLPAAQRGAAAEFVAAHIPGALFLDLATFTDAASPVPSALPTAAQFAHRLEWLGIRRTDRVVIYDDSDIKTSARAWFILRMHGMRELALLDGGLAKWRAEGRLLEAGPAPVAAGTLQADDAQWTSVRTKADMLGNIASGREQVLDARDPGRFSGTAHDTIHGLPGGHIPGSRNLFFRDLLNADGTFKPEPALRAAFERAGVDLARPIVTTCGSGVTAAVLLFALDRLGVHDAALYDGSWSEWGADPATPKQTGLAN